jgi:DNA-binding NtrC family response regulator
VLRAARAQEDATGTTLRVARTDYLPSLSASVGWRGDVAQAASIDPLVGPQMEQAERNYQACLDENQMRAAAGLPPRSCTAPLPEPQVRDQLLAQNSGFPFGWDGQPLSASLSISLPLFTGLNRQQRVEEARVSLQDARHAVRSEELRVQADAETLLRNVVAFWRTAQLQARVRETAGEELGSPRSATAPGSPPPWRSPTRRPASARPSAPRSQPSTTTTSRSPRSRRWWAPHYVNQVPPAPLADIGPLPPRILVADDHADILQALRLLLKGEGYEIDTATSPAAVAHLLQEKAYDVILMDLNYTRDTTSGEEGFDLLRRIRAVYPSLPVVVMTAWGSVEGAVEAMRRGARDYVEKPWDNHRLLAILRAQVELGRALRRSERLEAENDRLRENGGPEIVAESRPMRELLAMLDRVAPSDASVLITGEHGVGKEVLARRLHAASSRSRKPLIVMHAGGLSEGIFESELFGHVRGAFTDAKTERAGYFEMADGGTLFLDEIGTMPMKLQAKLLRVLQTGEFQRVGSTTTRRANVRLVSATNADLHAEAGAGRFREDLLYRLNTVEMRVPPLRDRRADIPLLAEHFLKAHSLRYRKDIRGFDPDAMLALLDYEWPGNVRELEHTVERAVLMVQGDVIAREDLNLYRPAQDVGVPSLEGMSLDEVECHLIRKALERHGGNVSQAAEALGLSRSALYRRIDKFGL